MVHIHVAVYGEYVAQVELQELWSKVLEDKAIVDIRSIRMDSDQQLGAAFREVLKYVTKGESRSKLQAAHAAAVEFAFKDVHRLSVGGALRRFGDQLPLVSCEDVAAGELVTIEAIACPRCGPGIRWIHRGFVDPETVAASGGFRFLDLPMIVPPP